MSNRTRLTAERLEALTAYQDAVIATAEKEVAHLVPTILKIASIPATAIVAPIKNLPDGEIITAELLSDLREAVFTLLIPQFPSLQLFVQDAPKHSDYEYQWYVFWDGGAHLIGGSEL